MPINSRDFVVCTWSQWTLSASATHLGVESLEYTGFIGPRISHFSRSTCSCLYCFLHCFSHSSPPLPTTVSVSSFFPRPPPYLLLCRADCHFSSLWTQSPRNYSSDNLHSVSTQEPYKDLTLDFESQCLCIYIWYFLFQLFLSCYQ